MWWALLVAIVLLISPNLISYATHGTADLLLASGFTLDEWVAHLQREHRFLDMPDHGCADGA